MMPDGNVYARFLEIVVQHFGGRITKIQDTTIFEMPTPELQRVITEVTPPILEGEDPYRCLAAVFFACSREDVTSRQRESIKLQFFGKLYGCR
jgi:hypothetical protein